MQESKFTFEEFCKNINKDILSLKQLDAVNYRKLLTLKAIKEQTKELNFTENWNKELDSKIEEVTPLAQQELKDASSNVDSFISTLIKSIYKFIDKNKILTKEQLESNTAKVRALVAISGNMDTEYIFNLVKVLYFED